MDYVVPAVSVIGGLAVLLAGGEVLLRGAVGLAAAARISPLVIGLTVVAFGTSAPEFAVTIQASLVGQADLAVGNVVGSNIVNILCILGLAALAAPLVVSARVVRWDVPLMVAASALALALGLDGRMGRWEGGLLVGGLAAYVVWIVRSSRREGRAVQEEFEREFGPLRQTRPRVVVFQLVLVVLGLVLLAVGSRWLVDGSVTIARLLGVSELLIGLTIIAVGTSLPELVTSVLAGIRGERDIAVGNVIGSCMFNILGVLGVAALLSSDGVRIAPAALRFDMPVMLATAVACMPIVFTGHVIDRWEGGLFFAYYLAYTAHLVLAATNEDANRTFERVMLVFVIPLTVLTLAVGVARAARSQRRA